MISVIRFHACKTSEPIAEFQAFNYLVDSNQQFKTMGRKKIGDRVAKKKRKYTRRNVLDALPDPVMSRRDEARMKFLLDFQELVVKHQPVLGTEKGNRILMAVLREVG